MGGWLPASRREVRDNCEVSALRLNGAMSETTAVSQDAVSPDAMGRDAVSETDAPSDPGVAPPHGWSVEEWLLFLERGLRRMEIGMVQRQETSSRRPVVALAPPLGWRHPVTGRRELAPGPELVALGMHVRRARYYADLSQQRLSNASGVSQSQISRLERALAPSIAVERLAQLAAALGRVFPLGACPHDHACAWQPLEAPASQDNLVDRLVARFRQQYSPAAAADDDDSLAP
jgi:transcriptional regulator with XRE-family HTH domain